MPPETPSPVFRRVGRTGWLVDLADAPDPGAAVQSVAAGLRSLAADGGLTGVVDLVPAAETVLVTVDGDAPDPRGVIASHWSALLATEVTAGGDEVEIPVRYDGPDLAGAAEAAGMTPAAFREWHRGTTWRAAFGGFAPGFFYLVPVAGADGSTPTVPDIPRRPTPRTSVPAGSVAVAAGYSAVYPSSSPGGWQLIGSTDAVLWDTDRPQPNLITAGQTVRFTEVTA
ncbi:allophanate hydrolase subunit 1 [Corynebacterium bovis]|uniref:5-oxoprolinase subunit B family protein n=1 Tax=Corynebacterium bovis TaxID=36808 RepID=UPI0031387474